jgi:hypothetical protein
LLLKASSALSIAALISAGVSLGILIDFKLAQDAQSSDVLPPRDGSELWVSSLADLADSTFATRLLLP